MANLKSEVAPKGMEFKPTEFILGGKYSTILTVIAFPRNIAPGFLSDITKVLKLLLNIFLFNLVFCKKCLIKKLLI